MTTATTLAALRKGQEAWRIEVLLGPNMKHLGKRDPRLFGAASYEDVVAEVERFAAALGVTASVFASDYEGELLQRVHAKAATADGYLVEPGGAATTAQGWTHALAETKKPVVEVNFYNLTARGEISLFTPSAIGRSMGLRQHSLVAALIGLVLSLDDTTFLNPREQSPISRSGGAPYVRG